MSVYTPPDITIDREAIYQAILTQLQTDLPGLTIEEGTFEWALLRGVASLHADQLEVLYERAEGEYDAYGTKLVKVPHLTATPAIGAVEITAADTDGHELAAGTGVTLAVPGFDRVAFRTTDTAVIAPGDTTAIVHIAAVNGGIDGNGLSLDPQLDLAVAWVEGITVTTVTGGGAEGETDTEYLDKLSSRLQLLGDTLTTPGRFAIAAELVQGVAAAMALDLFKPGPPYDADPEDDDIEGHLTVAVRDTDGQAVSGPIRTTVQTFLAENAISPLTVWVIDPTFTTITVNFAGVARDGADPAIVEAAAIAALEDFLSPATWGQPVAYGAIVPGARRWEDRPIVRFQHVSAALDAVTDLDHWTTLTINGGTADVTLDGPAGLPDATVTGAVT